MPIVRKYKKKFKGVNLQSGHFYKFRYSSWINDPEPTVIFMYSLEGMHPNTGHQWRFLQSINFTYVPRTIRKQFVKEWKIQMEKTRDPKFTWQIVKSKYPQIQHAVRRYFIKPNYYITKLQEIPFDNIEKEVVSTWHKDFSKKIKSSLLNKFRRVMRNRKLKRKK